MTTNWKTIRVFISSTFRDMHAERDQLARTVFPELKAKCRERRVHLIDIDLRWGVTEQDAQDGKVLDVCLDEIDSCRPYFLGLLGHRYGWIPPGQAHSITAQEIYHGVLHGDLPKQIVDFNQIIEDRFESRTLSAGQKECLVKCYQWDARKRKYLLRSDTSPEEVAVIRSVFERYAAYQKDRSFFFFRSESLTSNLAGSREGDFFAQSEAERDRLAALKKEIMDAGLPFFEYDDFETFGQRVLDLLWERISAELDHPGEEENDWLKQEAELHALFMADRTRRFVGRREVLDRLHTFCEQRDSAPLLVVTGDPGCGKSALLARFSEEIMHRHPDWLVISHFVGASPASTSLRQTLRRFCTQLNRTAGADEAAPEDIRELTKLFPELLTKAAAQRQILIILDAANQFEQTDNAHALQWLPQGFGQNVRFVMSTLPGQIHEALLRRRLKPPVETVKGLIESEIEELVSEYLQEIRREFPTPQVGADFFRKVKPGNPLYILVALEELRVFGQFEEVGRRVNELPDGVPALFDQVLARIETDFGDYPNMVRDCMVYLGCGRAGMAAEEMRNLLKAHAPRLDPQVEPERLPDLLWSRLYRAFAAYLFERTGVIDFFHGQLKEAVSRRYLQEVVDRDNAHRTIADYLRRRADPQRDDTWLGNYPRGLRELPYHLSRAGDEKELHRLLTTLSYLATRMNDGEVFELIGDYDLAAPAPELVEWREFLNKHSQRLTHYPTMLAALVNHEGFANGLKQLDAVKWRHPWLRTSAEQMPQHKVRTVDGLNAEVAGSMTFPKGKVAALAPERGLVFRFEHLGAVRVFDANEMRETEIILPIRRERPLTMICSPDAKSLVIFYESGEAELYHCLAGVNELPATVELVTKFRFCLPEFEDPVAVWWDGSYLFQSRPEALARLNPASGQLNEELLPDGFLGELAALVYSDKARLIALRRGGDSLLLGSRGDPLVRSRADVISACACGPQNMAVAFSDGALVEYQVEGSPVAQAEVRTGLVRGALGWDGERIVWLKEYPGFHSWRPGEAKVSAVVDNEKIFPASLLIIPKQWLREVDGTILLLTTHSVVRFNLSDGGAVTEAGRVEVLFGGPVWRAVRKQGNDQWLMEGPPPREVLLGRGVMGRLYCAPDGKGRFFAASGYGPGQVFDLATLDSVPLQGCPPGVNLADGDPDGGCWLTDREGDIYFVDPNGRCSLKAKIGLDQVTGPRIHLCGEYLVWYGYSARWYPDTGAESSRSFVFFRRRLKPAPSAERAGERFFAVREGLCSALTSDSVQNRLVMLWTVEGTSDHLIRVASVEEFIEGRYQDLKLSGEGSLGFVQMAISPDGHWLGIVNQHGDLIYVSMADGRAVATLSGSSPFTWIAAGGSGSEFWLVEAREHVYRCTLSEP